MKIFELETRRIYRHSLADRGLYMQMQITKEIPALQDKARNLLSLQFGRAMKECKMFHLDGGHFAAYAGSQCLEEIDDYVCIFINLGYITKSELLLTRQTKEVRYAAQHHH